VFFFFSLHKFLLIFSFEDLTPSHPLGIAAYYLSATLLGRPCVVHKKWKVIAAVAQYHVNTRGRKLEKRSDECL
jgi:hypothetical protein